MIRTTTLVTGAFVFAVAGANAQTVSISSNPQGSLAYAIGAGVIFGWSAYIVPFMFVVAPELLLHGPLWMISETAVTTIIGVWMVSAGFLGYFSQYLSNAYRLLFVIAGAAMMFPASTVTFGLWTDIGWAGLAILLILWEKLVKRRC